MFKSLTQDGGFSVLARVRAPLHSRIVSSAEGPFPSLWLSSFSSGTRSWRPLGSPKGGGITGVGCGLAGYSHLGTSCRLTCSAGQ